MNYVIVDNRDNTYFQGLSGWTKLEENAIWYDKEDADELCATLNESLHGNGHLYVAELV